MTRVLVLAAVVLGALAWPSAARAQSPFTDCPPDAFGLTTAGEEVRPDGTHVYTRVHATCGGTQVWADEVALPPASDDVIATGNVVFQQDDLTVFASRAVINRKTRYGTFEGASGWARITDQQVARDQFGTMEPDLYFSVAKLQRVGPRTYTLTNGWFSTCTQPTPRWDLHSTSGTITLDDRVTMRNAVLRVKNVPLFYLPWMYYPIGKEDRATGFLLPKYQSSTIGGAGIGNAFFWAIARNMDATLYHDYFSKSGVRYGGEYRYIAAPGSQGNLTFTLFNEKQQLATDGSVLRDASRSIDMRGSMSQALPRGFRLTARTDYVSDVTTRQLYTQNYYDFSNRQRSFAANVTGTIARYYRLGVTMDQRDYFFGQDGRRHGNLPSVQFSTAPRTIGRSRIYVSSSSDFSHIVDQADLSDPATNLSYSKINLSPAVRAPLSKWSFLDLTASAQWQFTRWFESQDPDTGEQVPQPLNRSLIRLSTNMSGPKIQRVWDREGGTYADRLKHLIEPNLSFSWLSPFSNFDRVPAVDFDRQVGGTTTITYGVTNFLYARKPVEGGRGQYREILRVSLNQSYYTDPRAAIFDQQYQSSRTASSYSPLKLSVDSTPVDRFTASFTTDIDPKFKTPRVFSATARYGSPQVNWQASWAKQQYIEGLPGFDDPRYATHSLGAGTQIRLLQNRVGGSYAFNYDVKNKLWVRQSFTGYYNTQCCGLNVSYQVVNRGYAGLPSDHVFNFSFTLAGIGSFDNPLGGFGDSSRR
ncbi:MAG: putative LPS assembly protein LptD [Vicinamibacterales bacterium]